MTKITAAVKREILHQSLDQLLEGIDPKELYRYAVAKVGVKAPSTGQALYQLRHCHPVLTDRYEDTIVEAIEAATPEAIEAFRKRHPQAKNAMVCQFDNGNVTHTVVLQRIDTPTPTVWWIENDKIKDSYKPLLAEVAAELATA